MPRKNIVIGQKVQPEKVAQAKELRDTMTPAERYLWQHLRANRLDGWHFRRQQIIDGFIVDFYCHQADLVIEVDGPIHELQGAAGESALLDQAMEPGRVAERSLGAQFPGDAAPGSR